MTYQRDQKDQENQLSFEEFAIRRIDPVSKERTKSLSDYEHKSPAAALGYYGETAFLAHNPNSKAEFGFDHPIRVKGGDPLDVEITIYLKIDNRRSEFVSFVFSCWEDEGTHWCSRTVISDTDIFLTLANENLFKGVLEAVDTPDSLIEYLDEIGLKRY